MLDIDAEFILPILHAYRGAVHAQASAADQAVGRTLQGIDHMRASGKLDHLIQDFLIIDVSGSSEMLDAQVVQAPPAASMATIPGQSGFRLAASRNGPLPNFAAMAEKLES